MPDQLQLRGGTTTEHGSFTGASKEVTVDTTKKTLVVHDGATQGGIPLMKESGGNAQSTVQLGTNGNNVINISNSQKVGIGIASAVGLLHLHQANSGTLDGLMLTNSDTTNNGLTIGINSNEEPFFWNGSNTNMLFATDNNQKMCITNDGKLGLGTSVPSGKLDIQGSSSNENQIFIRSQQGGAPLLLWNGQGVTNSNDDSRLGIGRNDVAMIYTAANASPVSALVIGNTDSVPIVFSTNNTQRMRIASDGKVGINEDNPSAQLVVYRPTVNGANPILQARSNHDTTDSVKFEIDGDGDAYFSDLIGIGTTSPAGYNANANDIVINRSGNAGITVSTPNSNTGRIAFGDPEDNNVGQIRYQHSDNKMIFDVGAGERMLINSTGQLAVGRSDPRDWHSSYRSIQLVDAGQIYANANDSFMAIGANHYLNSGGNFIYDKTDFASRFYQLDGSFVFENAASGSAGAALTFSQKMVLTQAGNLGIATNTPGNKLSILGSNEEDLVHLSTGNAADNTFAGVRGDNEAGLRIRGGGSGRGGEIELAGSYRNTDPGIIKFSTTTGTTFSERMRIAADGKIFLSSNTNISGGGSNGCYIANSQQQFFRAATGQYIHFKTTSGTGIGKISNVSDTQTNYDTTSDYRLKENETAISDGITRVKTLKPYKFNWKSDSTRIVDGFFAHEVTAVPEAVSGTKDAIAVQADVDEGLANNVGDPVYQSIDHSKLVPLLTAALQEAIAKIETLEATVAALEAA